MELEKEMKMNLQYFSDPNPDKEKEEEVTEEAPKEETKEAEEKKAPEVTEVPTGEPEGEPKDTEKQSTDEQSEELAQLKQKLAEAEGFKTQYETAKEELHKYETSLASIAEQKINTLPEEYRGLVPEGDTQSKLDWLAKAEKSGLFGKKEEKSIGQSTKANHQESQEVEMKDMTANQKLLSGIKEFYSRSR